MRFRTLRSPTSILVAIGIYLVLGVLTCAAFLITQDLRWITEYFRGPAALMSLWFSALALALAVIARRNFEPGDRMYLAWKLYFYSTACDLTAILLTQVLASDSWLNPLRGASFWTPASAGAIRDAGMLFNGLPRYALLAGALLCAIRAYRSAGLLARLRPADHLILLGMGAFMIYEMFELITALRDGRTPRFLEIIGWPVDPLLWFLLLEALLLWRSAREMGGGRVARCWKTLGIGVMLIAAGDLLLMIERLGYLQWPYLAIGWYIWLPAAAAFALAPAYQVEAVEHATETALGSLR